jgi:hypothetical protein
VSKRDALKLELIEAKKKIERLEEEIKAYRAVVREMKRVLGYDS